ncbi:MAG: hypothetical protein ACYC93_13085 [Candidatus Acidiferrales bacterium]
MRFGQFVYLLAETIERILRLHAQRGFALLRGRNYYCIQGGRSLLAQRLTKFLYNLLGKSVEPKSGLVVEEVQSALDITAKLLASAVKQIAKLRIQLLIGRLPAFELNRIFNCGCEGCLKTSAGVHPTSAIHGGPIGLVAFRP